MSRTMSLDRRGAQERTVSDTAVVAVLSSLGLAAGTIGAVAVWPLVGGVPIVGHAITVGVGLAVAIGLPAVTAGTGRAIFGAAGSECDPGVGRDDRPVRPTASCGD